MGSFDSTVILGIVVFLAGIYLAGRFLGRFYERSIAENTRVNNLKILSQVLLIGVIFLSIFYVAEYPVSSSLPLSEHTATWSILVDALSTTILAATGAWVTNRSLQPAARRHFGPSPSLEPALRWYSRLIPAGALFVIAVYLHAGFHNLLSFHIVGIVGIPIVLWLVVKLASLPIPSHLYARPATDEERQRLEECIDDGEKLPSQIFVDERKWRFFPIIFPRRGPFETLTVRASVFDEATDQELSVALAHALARSHNRMEDIWQLDHDVKRVVYLAIVFSLLNILNTVYSGAIYAEFYVDISSEAPLYAIASLMLALIGIFSIALIRRRLHQGVTQIDDSLSRRFGTDGILEVYSEHPEFITCVREEDHFGRSDDFWLYRFLPFGNIEPLLSERLERLEGLEGRTESDAADDRSTDHR